MKQINPPCDFNFPPILMRLAQNRDFITVWLYTRFGGIPLKFEQPILHQKLELLIY